MSNKQLPGRVDAVALAGEADVHHRQGGMFFPGKTDRFFRSCRGADDLEPGVAQGGFGLHGDQEVVLDDENARR